MSLESVFPVESVNLTADIESAKVGARLRLFASNWTSITSDPWVLSTIRQRYKIEFLKPFQNSYTSPRGCFSPTEWEAINEAVIQMYEKGAIRVCSYHLWQFISNLFLVPKKSGELRPAINLKALNFFVRYVHFEMENINSLLDLLRSGDFIATVDLKDAYFTVPKHDDYSKYLRFCWNGMLYEFLALPFGLSSAPRIFTKIMKPVIAYLRSRAIRLVIFLDDVVLGGSVQKCQTNVTKVIDLLGEMGFIINHGKSNFTPRQIASYFGYVIDTSSMRISLPLEKCPKCLTQ